MAAPSVVPSIIRSLILLFLVGLVLYFIAKWIIWLFGGGNAVQHNPVMLQVEGRGTVNVSLEGGLLQRAEDTIKLYPGDRVTTGGNGHAIMDFFDGGRARIDVQSDLTVTQSVLGTDASQLTLQLAQGSLWVRTPTLENFSGAITRTIDTPRYDVTLPSDTEAVIEERRLLVFSADGAGVTVSIPGINTPLVIGEGQQYELPDGGIAGDPYRYRSAIEPLAVQRDFIEDSRSITLAEGAPAGSGSTADEVLLSVTAPADKTVVTTMTVRVGGTVAKRVERVRVNGYNATIDRSDNSFSQELSLKENTDTTITIEALDARGIVLATEIRSVRRGTQAITAPAITAPAKTGETYRTQQAEFAIRGTVPAGTAGVMVNDYKLQLFRSGDTTWSYLASTALSNMKPGTNVFTVYALDAAGNKSEPATITILLEPGTEGVVSGGSTGGTASSAAPLDEASLPKNTPLMPGTITVTGPAAGTSFTATGSEFLLEGTAPKETTSVWVNGYRLQLYKAGSGYWNYIAKTEYNTLKPGTNVYKITARNANNEILDTFEYTVTYNP